MTEIVVGVDGSESSAAALRWAAHEAELHGSELVAVLAWDLFNQHHPDGSRRFLPEYDDAHADAALLAYAEAALGAEPAARVIRRPVCDVPAQGLIEAAKGADLLVLGARGLGGFRGLLLGSVSQQCLHHATGPIAIVHLPRKGEAGAEGAAGRIVVGVDGSDSSQAALRWALTEGALRHATVEALLAWEVPVIYGPVVGAFPYDTDAIEAGAREHLDVAVAEALAAAGTPEVTVERTAVAGGPASLLLDAAEEADLVVIGRRGLGGFGRLMLGSVSEHVARHARCPVVVLPPAPAVAAGE
ncbi:MAG TPA: universal stress protein [Acidimicrobiales bacterium]